MSLIKLRLSMIGTLAILFGISTLVFAFILSRLGSLSIFPLLTLVVLFNIGQWLFAPYMIDMLYGAREISRSESPELHAMVENISRRANIPVPRLMLADIPIPNAFAYGSPIAGTRVAVTTGLLQRLEDEEVEAVLGHELGHIRHRDVQIMMLASVLPAIFYYLGYSFLWFGRSNDRRNGGVGALIGIASLALYWILSLLVLHLSRLREYYADLHSVSVVDDGARKLSEALAKIASNTGLLKARGVDTSQFSTFKALFIADPDTATPERIALRQASGYGRDQELVRSVVSQKIGTIDRIMEVFSTHPNIIKRLRALQPSPPY